MRILLAEDDRFVAHVLRRALQQLGHEVTVATNGRDAWELLRRHHHRVVISDWIMPEMDGIEFCQRIRRDLPPSPYTYVIMLSARDAPEHRIEGLDAGVDEFLVKPFDEDELRARLAVAQRLIAMQDEIERHSRELEHLRREAEYHATHDDLTGVLSRRAWFAHALREPPHAIAVFDLDHFKRVNDEHGHPTGDHVLKAVTALIVDALGNQGVLGRVGGEEFAAYFGVPPAEAARVTREAVRRVSRTGTVLPTGASLRVTVSAGLTACTPPAGWSPEALEQAYERADQALYMAKRAGRNRLVTADGVAAA